MKCIVCESEMINPKKNQYTCGDQDCVNICRWFVEHGGKEAFFRNKKTKMDKKFLDQCYARVFRGLAA